MMTSSLTSPAALSSKASLSSPTSSREAGGKSVSRVNLSIRAQATQKQDDNRATLRAAAATGLAGVCLGAIMGAGAPAFAANANIRLPPLSQDPNRCERAFVGNTIGQANGVADKLLDLRGCDYASNKEDLKGKTLSAALMSDANFDDADLTEVVMSKAYAVGASFKGTDFTNAVLDRVVFDGADLTGAKFNNTVLSGSTFDGSQLKDADFEDALIGYVDVQKVCRNSTLSDIAKAQLGCR